MQRDAAREVGARTVAPQPDPQPRAGGRPLGDAELNERAALACVLSRSLIRLSEALESTGLPIDAECACALREVDPATLLTLPDDHATEVLDHLLAVIVAIHAAKLAR